MNTRTLFSNLPTFVQRWKAYRKKLGGTPHGWTVMSDYCLDADNKANCITFTISPILGQPKQIADVLKKELPSDIKKMTHIPEGTINFIRNRKEFFSLVFLFPDKQKLFDLQYFKTDILALSESPMIPEENRERLKKFFRSLNQKRTHKKVLQNLSLITFLFGRIVEYLTIKHNAEAIHWFPDRDNVMEAGEGIIKELVNISYTNAIAGRRMPPKLNIGIENPDTREFIFDPFIRYPDIITGVFSSILSTNKHELKQKHIKLLEEAVLGNPRIVWFVMYPDKIRCFDRIALDLLCQKVCSLDTII